MSRPQVYTFGEVFELVATWQGHFCYTVFSIYVIQPELFFHYFGTDIGPFLFSNMLYGQAVHIYTRPAMTKLRTCFQILFSLHGSYIFNFSSLLIFAAIGRSYQNRPLIGCIFSYFSAKFMYSMFYSYLYFVDKCADPTARRESVLEIMFHEDDD